VGAAQLVATRAQLGSAVAEKDIAATAHAARVTHLEARMKQLQRCCEERRFVEAERHQTCPVRTQASRAPSKLPSGGPKVSESSEGNAFSAFWVLTARSLWEGGAQSDAHRVEKMAALLGRRACASHLAQVRFTREDSNRPWMTDPASAVRLCFTFWRQLVAP
jgi:hypothetical protein